MNNKKNISVRLLESDLRKVKDVSSKLGVKDSDFFRYAVKVTLANLMPLIRKDLKGVEFLLALLSAGDDFLRHFEFDSYLLDKIVNDDADADHKVEMADIELVCIASVNQRYMLGQLRLCGESVAEGEPIEILKKYLEGKYLENFSVKGSVV